MITGHHVRLALLATLVVLMSVGLSGCLDADDEGGVGQADAADDAAGDRGGPEVSSDAGGADVTDDATDDAPAIDLGADARPDTSAADPLDCSLVDYGYGPIWDGSVDSATTGPEPAPLTGFTEAHNAVRRFVGVPELTWSSSLAADAQVWADHLAAELDCNLQHDPGSDQGENLTSAAATGQLRVTPQDVVGGWACEREDWDNDAISCNGESGFGSFPRSCGHYTQVVWDDTTEVGCATATCSLPDYNAAVWVCRYTPAGNWVGQRPYDD